MRADINHSDEKIVIIVRRGMVDSVFSNRESGVENIEVIDLDTTDMREARRLNLCAKKARKIYRQIY